MKPVPKQLGNIKKTWNPKTTLVSFKLETDESILEKKALAAIKNYGSDMVVANELETRRSKVTIYHKDGAKEVLTQEPSKIVDAISY